MTTTLTPPAKTPNSPAGPATQNGTAAAAQRPRLPLDGQSRCVIEAVVPSVDNGRFAVKRSVGELVRVEATAFVDGHDHLAVVVRHRVGDAGTWHEVDMAAVPKMNDRWVGQFEVHAVGWHEFTVAAWVDRFGTWQYDLRKRVAAGQDVTVDLLIGAELVEEAAGATDGDVKRSLAGFAGLLRSDRRAEAVEVGLGSSLLSLMHRHAPRHFLNEGPTLTKVWVDRAKARFSSWYEFFPRSASPEPGRHGTLKDVAARLDYVAQMGFDVLYLPPIHPIGRQFRKGKNNNAQSQPGEVGSPWAIGGPEGGHDAIHPDLGTFEDFDHLVSACKSRGIDLALDIAFQCSPDHPYVTQHPDWFRHRPDGSIQYAENPPKKYQDIYPFDFECKDWEALWNELLRVFLFWNEKGVKVFRVDNPHTKPFGFWEWVIAEVRKRDPEVLFLSEAFTRPPVMYRLAKLGFTQSYTYFAWRNDPWSIEKYLSEVTQSPVADFFRPNAWPNTPDINPEYLQTHARSAYVVRAVLAATLCANYGLYGPVFEQMDGQPTRPGAEEYVNSEKYEVRHWNLDVQHSLADLLARLNHTRRANVALQHDRGLKFHYSDNGQVVCFSKKHGDSLVLVVANTDPYHTHWANLHMDLDAMGLAHDQPFQVHDVLTDARYRWQGNHAVVKLDPGESPAHVFVVRKRARTEHDFEYFL